MKIVYLILAHNNPKHLRRLISALDSSDARFCIHIDRKALLDDFRGVTAPRISFTGDRVPGYWGDFSLVEATLVLLRHACAAHPDGDYFVLPSGTHYPLQSVPHVEAFFEKHRGREFINLVPMPCEPLGKSLSRLTTYRHSPNSSGFDKFIRWWGVKLRLLPQDRDYRAVLGDMQPYAGSQWWALTRAAAEHVMQFVERKPRVVKFFRHTVVPDEIFFQTILGNSPFREKLTRGLTYSVWDARSGSPSFIEARHLELFRTNQPVALDDGYGRGEVLFARKFSDDDQGVVDQIDQLIREKAALRAMRGG